MNFLNHFITIDLEKDMGLFGLNDEFFCVCLNHILRKEKKNILVVVGSLYEANSLYSSIKNYTYDCFLFPMDDFLTSEAMAISPDLQVTRLETINSILGDNKSVIIITNMMGFLRFLPKKEVYLDFIVQLVVGDSINPKSLVEKLIFSGYCRVTIVNKTGEIGVRGFIIDIFPVDEEFPVRIEFFDDVIESIRSFDPSTQKSLKSLDSILIKPYFEFLSYKPVSLEKFGKQKYLPEYGEVSSISGYLNDCITIFKDYSQLMVNYKQIQEDIITYQKTKDVNFTGKYMFDIDEISVSCPIHYLSVVNYIKKSEYSRVIDFSVKTITPFSENVEAINRSIRNWLVDGFTVLICLPKYQLVSITKNLNMKLVEATLDDVNIGEVNLIEKEINQGFIYQKFVVLSARELFIKNERKKKYSTRFKYATAIKDVSKLSVGDYVVHNIHGIGIYNGIKTLCFSGISKDYLEVLYQGTDKIYIPVEKIDLLSKYSGKEGFVPKINKLGSTEWEKTKARVRKRVVDMADKLLSLYAERESKKGFSFSKDCDMLIDFERDFPYELTKDQKRAIQQIKEDMESSVPMDRLLCGDVGFGKTEVAFVAAFKAILDSKQVLFLCPTTILSNQHYENAKVRFRNFPVSIALLNRFTQPREVKRILSGLKDGTIDLVFGTHRLLSDDVSLYDLGLLVIDEEQRFGVAHKEKIKQFKTNVDVLTLTATPIPRTLQMSLVGIRSLSLIETPPMNRYPVQTYVVEESNQVLRDAIYKELSRNGQVFILYNRVQSIEEESSRINRLIPNARIAVAHGQMSKNALESCIADFVNYEYDILICTTIIEIGIDIPNVNTLIIIDADRFGLSQLYQIRGRVGRSDKFAYAYLMYKPFKSLTETAVKRLNVIKEFTELGSGFSIATRDLSIRGAGDILGSEQAGFIDSVGIDLYLKMLNNEVNRRKNVESSVDDDLQDSQPLLNVSTHIADDYVDDDELKIEIHRKINEITSQETFDSIKLELEDRFGRLSEDLIIYMYEEWFEKLAENLKISQVRQSKNSIELIFSKDVVSHLDTEEIFMDAFSISRMFRFISKGDNLVVILDIIKLEKHPVYYLVGLLDKIYDKFGNLLD